MRTRTLLSSAAAVGLLLTGASAQTTRDETPRSGNQTRSQDMRPQGSQAERIQEPSRQPAAPQSSAPAQGSAPAQPRPQPAQQAQPQPDQSQQRTQQSQPQPQGTQSTTGQNQQPAPGGPAPAARAPQDRQPATTAQQPAQTQPQQSGQSQPQRPAQSQPQQTQSQPAQNNAAPGAQQRSSGVAEQRSSGVVALSTQQQNEVGRTITRHNVRPLTNVNFSIAVGTRVPRSVTLRALPTDLVTFVPQYRGYSFFVVEEQIVIVEPSSLEIVSIVPYASTSKTVTSKTAPGGKAMSNRSVKLSTEQRDVVRKHATDRKVSTGRKASATVRKSYQPGDRVEREVTIETFPETVYTEVPSIRRYRYFRDDDDVFLVDPDEDRVVDVIR